MHTPDGFLTGWVCLAMIVISLGLVIFSAIKIKKDMTAKKAYMMAGLAALVFGLQMLNFPIGNGTSGHLIGAALVALILGRHASVLVIALVVSVQALVYSDGGMLALGSNIFNMGIITAYSADYVSEALKKAKAYMQSDTLRTFAASWISVMAAALSASLMLWISGTAPFKEVMTAMLGSHAFIGAGEAIITGFAVYALKISSLSDYKAISWKRFASKGLLALAGSIVIISLALPFASQSPDGLEKVAINLGFFDDAAELYAFAPMPDYTLAGSEAYIFVLASGMIGMALCFGTGLGAAKALRLMT